jgi:hypothetical protein
MPAIVNRQQYFLHEILDVGRTVVKPASQEATQMRAQFREELPISGAIAFQAAQEQGSQMGLFRLRCGDIGSSIHLGRRLQETGVYSIAWRGGVRERCARVFIRVGQKILCVL